MDISVSICEALSPQQDGGSARLGSVWGRGDNSRKSTDLLDTASLRKSLNSGGTPTGSLTMAKRKAAAEFIKECTSEDIPYSNDLHFRQSLCDGRLLCQTLNAVYASAIPKIESGDAAEDANVGAFLHFMEKTNVPSEAKFSVQDLRNDGWDDRPRVVECLLWLQKVHRSSDLASPAPFSLFRQANDVSDVRAVRDSPRKGSPAPSDLNSVLAAQRQKHMTVVPATARSMASVQPNASFANLCSDISRTLMARLQPGLQPPVPYDTSATGVDVRAVMEQFLNGLSVEYERRLLAKDQELTASKEALTKLRKQMESVQAQLDTIRKELEDQQVAQMRAQAEASQSQLAELQQQLEVARAELAERTAALEAASVELNTAGDSRSARVQQLEAQLEAVGEQLQDYEALKKAFTDVREENKKLYNTVQDLKGSIRVFCRVRPLGTTGDSSDGCLDIGLEGQLAVYEREKDRRAMYRFDKVFSGDSTQAAVYEDVQTLIRSVMDGYNVCIFAYGQTGSGKTHTMTGTNTEDMSGRGINYRALDDLFALRAQRDQEMHYSIKAQMLEIYNESIRDLLVDNSSGGPNVLQLLSTQPSGENVPGANKVEVSTTEDVLHMMRIGARNRHMAATNMNDRSSRSHQVLTIVVDGENRLTRARTHACLHLVDLAGSERTDKSGVEGDRLREANNINSSLSALGSVMHALASKQKHVPFRNSKLTELLQDSLGGNAKVCMLMHVAPEATSYGESVSTLNFGNRVAAVTLGQAKANQESGKVFEANELLAKKDRQIEDLKRQLSEQASTIHSMRSSVEAAPALSFRSASFCTAHTHADAASTPGSAARTSRPGNSGTTPRNHGVYGYGYQDVQTPRSQSMRSPAPSLPLHALSRPPTSAITPRTSLHGASSASQGGEAAAPAVPSIPAGTVSALVEQLDKVAPLNSARGSRGQQQAGASTAGTGLGRTSSVGLGRSSSIPKLDTSSMTRPSTATLTASGSMSARTGSRYGGSSSSTAAAAQAVAAAAAAAAKTRPATSRTGGIYGSSSGNALMGPISRSVSVVLAEGPVPSVVSGKVGCSKPPLSSRPSGGWKS
ncbi:hypothetical protein HXX76_014234 [Chlamydomonas incerta]|uniref:Uncharacterized protein n=1 Tax=Chlamydomonas incerta TaxID=51695 RepID=A0A835VPW3_CHLIN|nr:hypothetical protein HXX76_014234 [Chlamydomonas incerta]|eukprot:KAG2424812.1 hypothetical protein HXX76_014234 [Chlamydomonas incerta]